MFIIDNIYSPASGGRTRSIKGWASKGTGVGREAPFHTSRALELNLEISCPKVVAKRTFTEVRNFKDRPGFPAGVLEVQPFSNVSEAANQIIKAG
jgi:hypothetical protein